MTNVLIVVAGVVLGFGVARLLRRPATRAEGMALGRAAAGAVGARRHLDLPQLQRAAFSEMVRHVVVHRGVVHVPDRFTVGLAEADHATVGQAPGPFRAGLVDALRRLGAQERWPVPATVSIDLVRNPAARLGQPLVEVPAVAAPAAAPASTPAAAPAVARPATPTRTSAPTGPAWVERVDGSGRWDLSGQQATVGRGTDRDIHLDDERASRRHATFRRSADGTWSIADEGSANGTRVNGDRVSGGSTRALVDGDQVQIGPVTLSFHQGPAVADPDGTVALDDRRREAVSRDLFPQEGGR